MMNDHLPKLICQALFIATLALPFIEPAFADTDIFHGDNHLRGLVEETKININLPGGAFARLAEGQDTYIVDDHLGSARVVFTSLNEVASRPMEYTPFGYSGSVTTRQGYTGMAYDPETASYDYHARRYDPSIGRFIGVDVLRQSISPYSYTENNPINFMDTTGLVRHPFFMKTNTEHKGDRNHLLSQVINHLGGSKDTHINNSDTLNREEGEQIMALKKTKRILFGQSKVKKILRNRKFFWFIGDKGDSSAPQQLVSWIRRARDINKYLARDLVVFDLTQGGNTIDYRSTLKNLEGTNLSVIKMKINAIYKSGDRHVKVGGFDIAGEEIVQPKKLSAYVDRIIGENTEDSLGQPPKEAMESEIITGRAKYTKYTKPTEPTEPTKGPKRLPHVEATARKLSPSLKK